MKCLSRTYFESSVQHLPPSVFIGTVDSSTGNPQWPWRPDALVTLKSAHRHTFSYLPNYHPRRRKGLCVLDSILSNSTPIWGFPPSIKSPEPKFVPTWAPLDPLVNLLRISIKDLQFAFLSGHAVLKKVCGRKIYSTIRPAKGRVLIVTITVNNINYFRPIWKECLGPYLTSWNIGTKQSNHKRKTGLLLASLTSTKLPTTLTVDIFCCIFFYKLQL